jgi:uncharacterized DUF497 family protein
MIFLWSPRNEEHLGKHDVGCDEAEDVVRNAKPPYPEPVGDEKHAVWGATRRGRYLQVIFVYAATEDAEEDEFARLRPHERMDLQDGKEAVRIIHARNLTEMEKRRLRRRKRGRQ